MRKFIYLFVAVLLATTMWAQSPQKMSYQAVIRDAGTKLVASQSVGMRISILQGSASGTAVYTETQTPVANANGLVSIEIGGAGFDAIDWSKGPYFIKTETDPTGGTNYTISGTSQLLSVPFALYAKTAESTSGKLSDSQLSDLQTSITNNPAVLANTAKNSYPAADAAKLAAITGTNTGDQDISEMNHTNRIALDAVAGLNTGDQDLSGKVDKVTGKGLSTNDYTTAEQTKLAGIYSGAEVNVNADWNASGGDAQILNKPVIPIGANTGDMQYWDGAAWVLLPRGANGQVLALNSSSIPSWQNASVLSLLPPTTTIQDATSIQSFSATLNGTVNANNLSSAVVFEWGLTTSYGSEALAAQNPVAGTSDVAVSANLTNLQSAVTYHYRIKASNPVNVTYSNDMSFTSGLSAPQLTTTAISSILAFSASSGGNISSDGGVSVTARGVCWSTSQNPTIADSKTADGSGSGEFTSNLNGLTENTTYYIRAYATNSAGTGYGDEISFRTFTAGSETVTDIDGNEYHTVTIGTQTWLVENLKTTKYNDGTSIPNVTDNNERGNLSTPGYCWYNNDATNKNPYGALYNGYTVNTGKLAPIGWHVPTDAEWTILTTYLGGESVAGGKLKETGTTHWLSPNNGATNESGFTALPGGISGGDGTFLHIGYGGFWWSSTENDTYTFIAWYRVLDYNLNYISRNSNSKNLGFSVRCVRD